MMSEQRRTDLLIGTMSLLVLVALGLMFWSVSGVAGQESFVSDPGIATVYRCSDPYSYPRPDTNQDGTILLECDPDWQAISWPTGIWPSDGWRVGGWVLDPNEIAVYECNGTTLLRFNMDDTVGTMETILYCHHDVVVDSPEWEVAVFYCPDGEFAEFELTARTVICQLDDVSWYSYEDITPIYTVETIDAETLAITYSCDGWIAFQYHASPETERHETRIFCNHTASRQFLPVVTVAATN